MPELAPADQLNNLKPVARLHTCRNPLGPRKNFKIALDGYALRRQTQMQEQSRYGETRRDFSGFAIHDNLNAHGHFDGPDGT